VKLSILIVSYNTREMALEALRSVYRETSVPFEVICVDNGSADGSPEAIAREFPQVHLIRSDNIGFAAANNIAVRQATGERLLLLNPDTVVIDAAIDHLWGFAERTPDAGIWGGRTLFADGTLNPTSCWGRMTPWSLACRAFGLTYLFPASERFNAESIGAWQRDSEREVDIVTGCFFLIDHALWDRLGGFNPDFVMYGEEADLCHRARALGARPRISPTATIIHHGGGSEASSADKLVKVMRGKVTLMNAHWGPATRLLGRGMFRVLVALRAAANLIVKVPSHAGRGQDARPDVWRVAFRRRREWLGGWELSRRG
jgi:GT2 family glycosyltransferase